VVGCPAIGDLDVVAATRRIQGSETDNKVKITADPVPAFLGVGSTAQLVVAVGHAGVAQSS